MKREPLLKILAEYLARHPEDRVCVERVSSFVGRQADCFERSCREGHITASAWIFSSCGDNFLLTHHQKLDRWLQLGGHVDGDPCTESAALREAREESGMESFSFLPGGGTILPVDVDVHEIPAWREEPAHWHYDIRYALRAAPGQAIAVSDESVDLSWFPVARMEQILDEESLLRMGRRANALLALRAV